MEILLEQEGVPITNGQVYGNGWYVVLSDRDVFLKIAKKAGFATKQGMMAVIYSDGTKLHRTKFTTVYNGAVFMYVENEE